MFPDKLKHIVVRVIGLDNHLAGNFPSSRPSCDLSQQLEGSFARSEIRYIQGQISMCHADQSDVRKIMSFGNHLCADEDVDFSRVHVPVHGGERVASSGGVSVEPGYLG